MWATPQATEQYILMLACEGIPRLDKESPTALTFIGGFDAPNIVNNLKMDTTFLAISYPAKNYSELRDRVGSIDFARKKN